MKVNPAAVVLAAIVCATGFAPDARAHDAARRSQEPTGRFGFSMGVSGSFSSPERAFASNYDPSVGLGVSMAFLAQRGETTGVRTMGATYLSFSKDQVDVAESTAKRFDIRGNANASIENLHVGYALKVPALESKSCSVSILSGVSAGGSRFTVDESAYESFGQSTLTELKHENNKTNLGTNRQFGIELLTVDHVSVQYSYNFVEIDRAWKFFHSFVSSVINEAVIDGVPRFVRNTLPENEKNTLKVHLATFVYQIGACVVWNHYTYEKGNWPFSDEPSMRYRRQMLGLNYSF